MKVYVGLKDLEIYTLAYTSLISICKDLGVSYNSASTGKRVWVKDGVIIQIKDVEVVKIKNRGKQL